MCSEIALIECNDKKEERGEVNRYCSYTKKKIYKEKRKQVFFIFLNADKSL
jgi:hypothetical protein